jgi:hypothetical protein
MPGRGRRRVQMTWRMRIESRHNATESNKMFNSKVVYRKWLGEAQDDDELQCMVPSVRRIIRWKQGVACCNYF